MNIKRINHVGIRVNDLSTSRAFYEQFGFEFVVGPVGPEPVAIMTHPCGIVLNFILNAEQDVPHNILMDDEQKLAGYTHMALEVDDLDACADRMGELEIPVSGGPVHAPNASFLFIRDPDRNVIEFNQPKTPGGFKLEGH